MTSSAHQDSFSGINKYWLERELKASEQELEELQSYLVKFSFMSKEFEPLYILLVNLIKNIKKQSQETTSAPYQINPEDEIKAINDEIALYYSLQDPESGSPRLRFLLQKRQYLSVMQERLKEGLPKDAHAETKDESEKKNPFKAIFNIGKKFIDLVDDVWSALRSVLPHEVIETFGPILIGATGFMIHLGEGYEGGKDAYHAYQNEKIRQRKTRILTSALTFMLAGSGAGLSIAYIASAAGASVAGVALMPVLIPGLLTAIYGLSLWRRSYIFDRSKIDEANAEWEYKKSFAENHPKLQRLGELITRLKERREKVSQPYKEIVEKVKRNHKLTPREIHSYHEYIGKMNHFSGRQAKLDNRLGQLQGEMEGKWKNYQHCRQHRLEAEREVAFTAIEVAASSLVLVGIALGTAAIVGASIASFGLLPLALIISGVVVGAASKIIENEDEKSNFSFTNGVRNWFINTWDKVNNLVSPSPQKAPVVKVNEKEKPRLKVSKLHQMLSELPESPVRSRDHIFVKPKQVKMKTRESSFFITKQGIAKPKLDKKQHVATVEEDISVKKTKSQKLH